MHSINFFYRFHSYNVKIRCEKKKLLEEKNTNLSYNQQLAKGGH